MNLEVRTITPADAEKLLSGRAPNRKTVRRRVAALADAMTSGEWLADGAPIRIDSEGHLLDGQHRLEAIIECGQTIKLVFVTGIDPKAQLVMDTGKARSLEDHLTIHEVANARSAAAATRFLWDYEQGVLSWRGDIKKRPYPTISQVAALYAARSTEIQDGVAQSQGAHRRVRMSKAVLAGMWPVLSDIDFDDASEFYNRLAGHLGDGAVIDSVEILVTRMNNQGRPSYGGKLAIRVQAGLMIKAWNAYRKGDPISRLHFKPGGASPESFPVPV